MVAQGRTLTYAELAACRMPVRAPLVQEARGTQRFAVRLWSAWRAEMPFVPLDPRLPGPPGPLDAPPGTATVIFTSGTTGRPRP
ncbi:MAG: hypothetical protein M3340_06925, partial [Actinomycetota bacterium]|nr:hypothetical protein [Actinomycetota bacterium]